MPTEVTSLLIRVDTDGTVRAAEDLTRLTKGGGKAEVQTKNLARATTQTSRSFRLMKGATQQVGFQVQDMAVQLASGTSFMQAFGQQGSQLAGIFGPGGAVIGALIAVGSAIGGVFVRSMMDGEESTESLRERILDLRDSVDDLTDAQIRQVKVEFFAENQGRMEKITEYRDRISDLRDEIQAFNNAGIDGTQTTAGLSNPDEARAEINKLNAEIDYLFQSGDRASQQLDELINGMESASSAAKEQKDDLNTLISALERQAETIGLSRKELALYEAERLGATEADKRAIEVALEQISVYERQEAARKAMLASTKITEADDPLLQRIEAQRRGEETITEIVQKEEQARLNVRRTMNQQVLSTAATTATSLASIIEDSQGKQSAAYKAAFLAQQVLLGAQTVMNTEAAATTALAPPPMGLGPVAGAGYAQTIRAMGYASAGIIAAQTVGELASISGRALGGQTRPGETYLVGERGPELLTMGNQGGNVTPNSRMGGDSGKIEVTQVFQISAGVAGTVKAEIMKSLPALKAMSQQGVLEAINRGGPMARATGRRT
ncbi:hypothetical protein QPM17_00470 [Marinobacter sp. TBZ242]|uniref:Tail length tape measure protein n=1 Tax=Marinobacter azerbaijanicus TaxID=3050455 RepID=A0ABT7I7F8_9GAMM|nr:hypothetical protein [Marinobacter sp. TBZ242]MDL0429585.1 hypothetical protein [Marinobacter sp. TBZ242]